MLIDFKKQLVNPLDGTPVLLSKDSPDRTTLSDVCVFALVSDISDEKLDGKAKFVLWELALKINKAEVELKAEEIATIKERLGKIYPTAIVGIAYNLLD